MLVLIICYTLTNDLADGTTNALTKFARYEGPESYMNHEERLK